MTEIEPKELSAMNKRLKIGLLLDSYILPAWEYDIIREITSANYAGISLIIRSINGSGDNGKPAHESLIYRLHIILDRFIFRGSNDYDKLKSIKPLLNSIPEIYPKIVSSGDAAKFSNESIEEIAKYDLDIILKFGFRLVKGQILDIPRYGVWSFSMDNYAKEKYGISGYYEVVKGNPVTSLELVKLREEPDSSPKISRSWISTCSYSVHLNRDKLFKQAPVLISGILEGISRHGAKVVNHLVKNTEKEPHEEKMELHPPSLFASIKNLFSFFLILFQKTIKKIFYTDPFSWVLFLEDMDPNAKPGITFTNYSQLKPAPDKFWADPFIINKGNKYFVFVEEYVYKERRAHISVLELAENGKLIGIRSIIEKPYHMSYPFVFEMGSEYYMIPETSENRTIDLYKCSSFPDKWEHFRTIMNDVNAVDSTLFYYNGKWWLFTTIDKIGTSFEGSPDLYLFHTESNNLDKWTSHPLNPVVSDIRKARPAGKIFMHDGKIYRPSQDCSGRYGRAFWLNEIVVLNETEYEEKKVEKIEPKWHKKFKGTHTFNFDGRFKIMDAYIYRKRIFSW